MNQFKNYDLATVIIELNRESERLEALRPEVNRIDRPAFTQYQEEVKCFLQLLQTGKLSTKLKPESKMKIKMMVDKFIESGHLPAGFLAIFGWGLNFRRFVHLTHPDKIR